VPGTAISVLGDFSVTYYANQIVLSETLNCGCSWGAATFNGPVFTDLTNPFTGFSVDGATNFGGFVINFSGGAIEINWQGTGIVPGNQLVLDVTTSPTATPLPSTWLMLLSGFLGLGVFACRGTKKNTVAIAAA
jgi:hypothetical protein